jgi:hypothetical protein
VEQLNTTLDAARVKPVWTPLSYAVIGATPRLCSSTRSLTGFKSYSRLTRFIVAIKSFMTKYGISGTAQSGVAPRACRATAVEDAIVTTLLLRTDNTFSTTGALFGCHLNTMRAAELLAACCMRLGS